MVHALQLANARVDRARVAHRLDHVPGARLALRADHGRAFRNAARGLAEVAAAADERDLERVLVDVVLLIRGREHFGLVDVVDAEGLQDLSLDKMADPALGHHRDGDGLHDRLDQGWIGHSGDAALSADVGRNPLERHHRTRARVLRQPGVLGRDDVHDHAALEHLGEPRLDLEGALHRAVPIASAIAFGHVRNSTRPI